ncbi:head-tail connector protein [Paenibacillus glucanolyticus]|uniref:head-tail connector protein n=1 Tax=Paenibacillus glucanolyticus TaxID=59843 RepID=UPI003F538B25
MVWQWQIISCLKVKANLILTHDQDDSLLIGFITAAISYAQSYQHVPEDYYETTCLCLQQQNKQ